MYSRGVPVYMYIYGSIEKRVHSSGRSSIRYSFSEREALLIRGRWAFSSLLMLLHCEIYIIARLAELSEAGFESRF